MQRARAAPLHSTQALVERHHSRAPLRLRFRAMPASSPPAKQRRLKSGGGPSLLDNLFALVDRRDPLVKARTDVAAHALLFAAACWLLHRYGHKLAV